MNKNNSTLCSYRPEDDDPEREDDERPGTKRPRDSERYMIFSFQALNIIPLE